MISCLKVKSTVYGETAQLTHHIFFRSNWKSITGHQSIETTEVSSEPEFAWLRFWYWVYIDGYNSLSCRCQHPFAHCLGDQLLYQFLSRWCWDMQWCILMLH